MINSDIKEIQNKLGVKLPEFYIETLLNYPFSKNSFGEEFMLVNDIEPLLAFNGIFNKAHECFAIGSDGGEYTYYIKLNGDESVYIFDLENSEMHNSLEAPNWNAYLTNIAKIHEEIEEDERLDVERKKNKKWWQFWI